MRTRTRAAQSDFVPGSDFFAAKLCLLDKKQARRVSYPTYPPKSYAWTEARSSSKLVQQPVSKIFLTLVRKIWSEKSEKKCHFHRAQSGNYNSGITRVFESEKNFKQSVNFLGSAKLGNLKSRSI